MLGIHRSVDHDVLSLEEVDNQTGSVDIDEFCLMGQLDLKRITNQTCECHV